MKNLQWFKKKEASPKLKFNPYCPKCEVWRELGDWHENEINFCPDCGTRLVKEKKCDFCEKRVDGGWEYCAGCGVKICR